MMSHNITEPFPEKPLHITDTLVTGKHQITTST